MEKTLRQLVDEAGGIRPVARKCGVNYTTISKWCTGDLDVRRADAIGVWRLAQVLGCTVADVVAAAPERKSEGGYEA